MLPQRKATLHILSTPMEFIDTHCHIYGEEFDADRAEVVQRAVEAGASALMLPNIDARSIGAMMTLCRQFPALCHPMMGLHPTELPAEPTPVLEMMEQFIADDRKLPQPMLKAIGEVGVDLYWDASRREEQMAVFHRQALWSCRYGLPLVVHSRSAHAELMEVFSPLRNRLCGGVFHCFGGTEEEARELLGFENFVLGIGGVVTFKKSPLPQVLQRCVPLERIVIETDAPYLAPTPHRGKRNEPAFLTFVIQRLAEVYATSPETVASVTTDTAKRIFRL